MKIFNQIWLQGMNMEKPKISVIMPSLNVGDYMEQCLSSVLNQSLKDIEVICVDAGSTDGTLEVAEKYARKYRLF